MPLSFICRLVMSVLFFMGDPKFEYNFINTRHKPIYDNDDDGDGQHLYSRTTKTATKKGKKCVHKKHCVPMSMSLCVYGRPHIIRPMNSVNDYLSMLIRLYICGRQFHAICSTIQTASRLLQIFGPMDMDMDLRGVVCINVVHISLPTFAGSIELKKIKQERRW